MPGQRRRYMVMETFRPGAKAQVYERFRRQGRMLPEGLYYIDSWLEKDGNRCFQLMNTDRPELFPEWVSAWEDLVSFEIVEIDPQQKVET
jgi:hypothetical protein